MSSDRRIYMFGGGGTGGHVVPAHNIAQQILRSDPKAEIIYLGARHSLEQKFARQAGYKFLIVQTAYLRRSLSLKNLVLPVIVLIGLIQALKFVRQHQPVLVIGTGGYSSLPVIAAAKLTGVPYVLQEANALPGLVTRLFAHGAQRIYLGYEAASSRLKAGKDRIRVTGNPVKLDYVTATSVESRTSLGLAGDRFTVFITGGSGGARSLNNTMEEILSHLLKHDCNVIWQVGKNYEGELDYAELKPGRVFVDRLLSQSQMYAAYQAADLVVARAGAMTLAELAAFGKPAILVPYPYSAEGHQIINAEAVSGVGAAIMILDQDLRADHLGPIILELKESPRLQQMSQAMLNLARPQAAEIIVKDLMEICS